MEISIIIPVYNVEKYIIRCLNSIAEQTYTESVECIIVDDCGSDGSMTLAKKFISDYQGNIQFKIVEHTKNRGIAAARNTGISNAIGNYVLHIDSDDYCEPDMLASYLTKAKDTDADIVVSDFWYTYRDHEVYHAQTLSESKVQNVFDFFDHKLFTVNWNKFIRRHLYTKNNITYLEGCNYGEDMRVCFPLFFAAQKIVHIKKGFVHYVQYNENAYNRSLSKKSLEDYIVNLTEVEKTLRQYGYYDSCRDAILSKELWLKRILLLSSKGKLQKKWCKSFPLADNYIMESKQKLLWKIVLFLASKSILWPFNVCGYLLKLKTKEKYNRYSE